MILLWLQTRIGRAVAGIGAILAILGAVFLKGRSAGRKSAVERQAKADHDTAERIKDALESSHSGGAAWRDRLDRLSDDE